MAEASAGKARSEAVRGYGRRVAPAQAKRIIQNFASAEHKVPRKLVRIRPKIFEFDAALGLKLGQTNPKISGTVPTNRHTKKTNP